MDSIKKEEGASPNMETPLTGFWMVEEEKKEEGEKDEGCSEGKKMKQKGEEEE